MCGIGIDCKNESEVCMFVLALATGVTVLPHQQAPERAPSLMTLLADIKSDQHIYKAKHFKNPRVYKFLKISFNITTGAACYCEQNTRNIDVTPQLHTDSLVCDLGSIRVPAAFF